MCMHECKHDIHVYNCTQYDCTVKYVYSLYMYIVHQHTCSSHDIKERSELYLVLLISVGSNGLDSIIHLLDAITISLQTMKESHPTCRLLLAADSLKVMNKCNCMHLVMYK